MMALPVHVYAFPVMLTLCVSSSMFEPPDLDYRQEEQAETCGDPVVDRITGGLDAYPGKWPWMAMIFLVGNDFGKRQQCGASLISDQTVLTAAHCVYQINNPSRLIVRLGAHNLAESGGQNQVDIRVKNIVIHNNYSHTCNDIAVLHLESKVKFTNRIRPVCMPKGYEFESFAYRRAFVTGWGKLGAGKPTACKLQEVKLRVIPNSHCQNAWGKMNKKILETKNCPRGIIPSMICARNGNVKKDACEGDSGGPLVHQTPGGEWIQIGIVSVGDNTENAGIPGIYTRVTYFLDWIAYNTI